MKTLLLALVFSTSLTGYSREEVRMLGTQPPPLPFHADERKNVANLLDRFSGEDVPAKITTEKPNLLTTKQAVAGARALKAFLDRSPFLALMKKVAGQQFLHAPPEAWDLDTPEFEALTEPEMLLFQFFVHHKTVNQKQLKVIFGADLDKVLPTLLDLGIVYEANTIQKTFQVNGFELSAYETPSGQPVYTFSDVYHLKSRQSTAMIAKTSLLLYRRLLPIPQSGIVAGFGSGAGLHEVAVLIQNPKVSKIIGLEIDPHARQVSRWNALLNGVSERFEVIDNKNPEVLTKTLNGKKLDSMFGNPPFNVAPNVEVFGRNLPEVLGAYGAGGPDGLSVTSICLKQAAKHLKPGGELILYSQLPQDAKQTYLLETWLKSNPTGEDFEGAIEDWKDPSLTFENAEHYAAALANYALGNKDVTLNELEEGTKKIAKGLADAEVVSLRPAFVMLRKTKERNRAPGKLERTSPPQSFLKDVFPKGR